jgi:UDP-glucose 4-epimerase
VIAKSQPELIFHLAAHHFIPFCNEHPRETLRVNVEGTHLVLSHAARHGARVAVVASSGAVYPNWDGILSEDVAPEPADIYGLSKLMAEQIAEFVSNTTDTVCVAARLFNTYGPYETNPHLIPHIIASLQQQPFVELGNLHTRRDYVYVDDVANALYALAQECGRAYMVANVGTGTAYSAEDVVRVISQLLGYDIIIKTDPARARTIDKPNQVADTRRLDSIIGRVERSSLAEGLRRLLLHEQFELADSNRV